jgi:hypothetical protein
MAVIASALSALLRIPEPFSRAVIVLQLASVGQLPICQPLAWNSDSGSCRGVR